MYNQLKERLWAYITENNPDLMFGLQDGYSVTNYLEDKVSKVMPLVMNLLEKGKEGHVIQELALNEMTRELRPSKFLYLKELLLREFPSEYLKYVEYGVLTYELLNLIELCKDVFETFCFGETTREDSYLRHAIIARVHEHLK